MAEQLLTRGPARGCVGSPAIPHAVIVGAPGRALVTHEKTRLEVVPRLVPCAARVVPRTGWAYPCTLPADLTVDARPWWDSDSALENTCGVGTPQLTVQPGGVLDLVIRVGRPVSPRWPSSRLAAPFKLGYDALNMASRHSTVWNSGLRKLDRPAGALSGGVMNESGLAVGAPHPHTLVADGQPTGTERPVLIGVGFPSVATWATGRATGLTWGSIIIIKLPPELIAVLESAAPEFQESD